MKFGLGVSFVRSLCCNICNGLCLYWYSGNQVVLIQRYLSALRAGEVSMGLSSSPNGGGRLRVSDDFSLFLSLFSGGRL